MATKQAAATKLTIRQAARYLQDRNVDIGELRMRTLVRQHEIFVNDPDTAKGPLAEGSDVEQWLTSTRALDAYIDAVKKGTVRSGGSGAKAYRINVDADKLAKLRQWAKDNEVGEPVRANKSYVKKSAPAAGGAPSIDELMANDDAEVGSDAVEVSA